MFIDIVDKILSMSYSSNFFQDKNKQEEVRYLKLGIDQLVYELYGLGKDEIQAIEDFRSNT
jgi:uncharacterized protein with PhoU and TrkA domain